jgi:hypothetical protein
MVSVENKGASLAGQTQPSADIEKIHVTLTRLTASFVGEDMNKRKIKDSELDAIGVTLITAGRPSGEEIDRIVSAPKLFDGVRERIATQERQQIAQSGWLVWKLTAASMAAVGVMIISSFAYFGFFNESKTVAVTISRNQPAVLKVEKDTAKREFEPVVTYPTRSEASRPKVIKALHRENIRSVQPKSRPTPITNEGEFYALNFAGNVEDEVRDGHIVRVDMPRSSLFAMGVDLPLENDAKFIKTDVLVGSDGVPRGIRFVE